MLPKAARTIASAFSDISSDIEQYLTSEDPNFEIDSILAGAAIIGESSMFQLSKLRKHGVQLVPVDFNNNIDESYQVSQKLLHVVSSERPIVSLSFSVGNKNTKVSIEYKKTDLPQSSLCVAPYKTRVQKLVSIGADLQHYGISGFQIDRVAEMGRKVAHLLRSIDPNITLRQILDVSAIILDLSYPILNVSGRAENTFETEYVRVHVIQDNNL